MSAPYKNESLETVALALLKAFIVFDSCLKNHHEKRTFSQYFLDTALVITCQRDACFPNSVFRIVVKRRRLRTVSNMFICNLAAADISVLTVNLPFRLAYQENSPTFGVLVDCFARQFQC